MPTLLGPGRLAVAALALGFSLLAPVPALADCMPAPELEQAIGESDLVFVGTVTSVEHGGRSATVEVEVVWRGGEMGPTVTVLGGRDPAQPMEDDRAFEAGVSYLFFPSVQDGRLIDGICSATTPWTDSLSALRPVDAHAPAPGTPAVDGPIAALGDLAPAIVTAALVGSFALVIAFVVGRRRGD